jgi:hypothetical protein
MKLSETLSTSDAKSSLARLTCTIRQIQPPPGTTPKKIKDTTTGAAPAPNGQGILAPQQGNGYLQGAVDQWLKQQQAQKQSTQLRKQSNQVKKQSQQPPAAPPPAGAGAPQSQVDTAAPLTQLFASLVGKVA